MPVTDLTRRQRAIYEFILRQLQAQGMPPTLMEIASAFDLSSAAGVADHLKAIERKGYIRRRPGVSRGIEVRRRGDALPAANVIPLLGDVPTSRGVSRSSRSRVTMDSRLAPAAGRAFRVSTGALAGDGILRGDVLVVDPDASARPGDLIVGRQGRNVALLRVGEDGRSATAVAGRINPAADVRAYGPVVSVVRSMRRAAVLGNTTFED
jgi:repressor LexA